MQCGVVSCSVLQCAAATTLYDITQHLWCESFIYVLQGTAVCCRASQCVVVCCRNYNTLQQTATHCNTLQHTATWTIVICPALSVLGGGCVTCQCVCGIEAAHCNTRQHIAAHCSTLQYSAAQYNTLQHTATHRNTLRHTATHCNTLQHTATRCNIDYRRMSGPYGDFLWGGCVTSHVSMSLLYRGCALQHAATRCNTL